MKKLLNAFILFFLLSALPALGQVASDAVRMHNAATTTGASSVLCNSWGYDKLTVEFDITGTASVEVECRLGTNTGWTTLTGTCIPATASKQCSITTYACTWLRTNIASCTGCTVTTYCQYWRYAK